MGKYIWRLLILSLAMVLAIGCSSVQSEPEHTTATTATTPWGEFLHTDHQKEAIPLPSKEHYTLMFNNMDGYWKHGQAVTVDGVNINTFIPQNEFVDKWNERIEITHVKADNSMTAQKYYNQVIKSNLDNICYYSVPKVKFLKQNTNDIIYEYHVLNCGKKPSIALIGRILHNGNNINTITYTVKTEQLDQDKRQYMLQAIQSARVI